MTEEFMFDSQKEQIFFYCLLSSGRI